MFCEKCGNKMEDGTKICPACGCAVVDAANQSWNSAPQVVTVGEEAPAATPSAATPEAEKKVKILGIIGIACGAVGLLFSLLVPLLAIPFAIGGAICSILGLKAAKEEGIKNTICIVGIVVSGLAVVAFFLSMIISIIGALIAALA